MSLESSIQTFMLHWQISGMFLSVCQYLKTGYLCVLTNFTPEKEKEKARTTEATASVSKLTYSSLVTATEISWFLNI